MQRGEIVLRIESHPILSFPQREVLHFTFNGKPAWGLKGDTIASALHNLGIKTLSHSQKHHRPRGFYCAIGNCASCNMVVNGKANVRTCITLLEEGMDVRTQEGKGKLYENI
jgi:aerobic-type carbon monoxide dehydrogenase small subunit (CoxS/CutS family)